MGDWVGDILSPLSGGLIKSPTAEGAKASANALAAQQSAADRAAALQEEQFAYQKSLQDPFFKGSLPAYYNLVDAITGKRQTYQDPNYTELNAYDAATQYYKDVQEGKAPPLPEDILKDIASGQEGAVGRIMRTNLVYDSGKKYYRGPNGEIVNEIPKITTTAFQPTETDAYKWQQSQNEKNNSRTLRALGRENSSYGMGEQFKSNQNLAASEYDKQLGRLADLTNIARGGASSLASASTGYTNNAGNNLLNMGANQANAMLAGGQLAQNSLYNNQNNMMSLANLGLKAYSAFGNSGSGGSGWDSSGGWTDGSNGQTYSAGDIEMANYPPQG